MLGVYDRCELRKDHLRDVHQVALALKHSREPGQVGLEPVLLVVLLRRHAEIADHLVDVVLEVCDLARSVDTDRTGQVALGHRRRDLGDGTDLRRQGRRQLVDVVGEVAPRARRAGHVGLTAQPSLGADLAGNRGHLLGKDCQRGGHAVDGVGELCDLALGLQCQLAPQVAVRDRRDDARDPSHLIGEVAGHRVDVVGQVLPDAGDAFHSRLAAQLPIGAHLARDARHLFGEGVELVDHGVDGVLELEDLAPDVDGDLLRQIPLLDRGGHLGDVADLTGQVAGHEVDVVGQVLPDPRHALHVGLTAEPSFGAHLTGYARHLVGEGVELVDHGVDGVLELEDLALDVDRDLLRQVAVGDSGGDLGDVADLAGQIAGHQVHVVGQVFPDAPDAPDLCLAAELALGAHLAGDTSHLAGEGVELVDHGVDGVLELEDLALDVDRDLLRQVAVGDSGGDLGDVADLAGQVAGHQVHVVGQVLPDAANPTYVSLTAELALGPHLARHARDLTGERIELADHGVHGPGGVEGLAVQRPSVDLQWHGLGQVAVGHCADDARNLGVRPREVLGEVVDGVERAAPGAWGLAAGRRPDLAFFAYLPAQAADLALEPLVRLDDGVESRGHLARGS